jgi:hypothetical protein
VAGAADLPPGAPAAVWRPPPPEPTAGAVDGRSVAGHACCGVATTASGNDSRRRKRQICRLATLLRFGDRSIRKRQQAQKTAVPAVGLACCPAAARSSERQQAQRAADLRHDALPALIWATAAGREEQVLWESAAAAAVGARVAAAAAAAAGSPPRRGVPPTAVELPAHRRPAGTGGRNARPSTPGVLRFADGRN